MTEALMVQGLTKTYGNGFQALKGIDLSVEQGDFFALLGPNGAGKSTTLGILCGLIQKSSGTAKVMGFDVNKESFGARSRLGVVPQEFNFNQFERVLDIVLTQAGYFGLRPDEAMASAEFLLRQLELWEKRDEQSRMLSGGMKRRLMIARALVHKPDVLILDEPTAGVDIELRRSMWEFLRGLNESGTTIVLTTHYLEEAEQLCRNIAIIDKGEIVRSTSVRGLLSHLKSEVFVLDLENPPGNLPEVPGFTLEQPNPDSIEVVVREGQNLNQVFDALTSHAIRVRSMRPKANRLEEVFVELVRGEQ